MASAAAVDIGGDDGVTSAAPRGRSGGALASALATSRRAAPRPAPPAVCKLGAELGRSPSSTRSQSLEAAPLREGGDAAGGGHPGAEEVREAVEWLAARASKDGTDVEEARRMKERIVDEVADLRSRVDRSSELIQQLKTVIRAQHGKIEDLRDPNWNPLSPNLQLRWIEDHQKESKEHDEAAAQMKAQVASLANRVRELKASNAQLRRVNRRQAALLSQLGDAEDTAGSAEDTDDGAVLAPSSPSSPIRRADSSLTAASPESRRSMVRAVTYNDRASAQRDAGVVGHVPSASASVSQMTRQAVLGLWRDPEPHCILRCILHSVGRFLEGHKNAVATLYVGDPWLRRNMTEAAAAEEGVVYNNLTTQMLNPVMFYLNGKVPMHAIRRDGAKPEAPRFTELAQLPVLGGANFVALPVSPVSSRGRPFAVLQITQATAVGAAAAGAAPREEATPAAMAAAISETFGAGGGVLGLTAAQIGAVQLVCSTAAGILDMRRSQDVIRLVRDRARSALGIIEEACRTTTVCEFESHARPLISKFFNVGRVRISFFDSERREMLTTTIMGYRAQGEGRQAPGGSAPVVGRRHVQRFPTDEGVIGRCARAQTTVHLERIRGCPIVSPAADGVDLAESLAEANMLAGPMVARFGDGRCHVMGVVQLMHKLKRSADDPLHWNGGGEPSGGAAGARSPMRSHPKSGISGSIAVPFERFTREDEDFFSQMLSTLGLALWKTIEAQKAATGLALLDHLMLAA